MGRTLPDSAGTGKRRVEAAREGVESACQDRAVKDSVDSRFPYAGKGRFSNDPDRGRHFRPSSRRKPGSIQPKLQTAMRFRLHGFRLSPE